MDNCEFYLKGLLWQMFDGVYSINPDRKVTFWNPAAEQYTGFTSAEMLGRSCCEDLLMHINELGESLCLSGCPLSSSIRENKEFTSEVYLRHKEGHRVLVQVRTAPIRDPQGNLLGALEVFRPHQDAEFLAKQIKQLQQLALFDSLTGLVNRRHLEITLHGRMEEYQRYGWPFGILFIDIDRFKSVNDNLGHAIGDKVLKLVALTLQNSLRPFDVLGRWGGEEFIAVIVNISPEQLAYIANRARMLVEQSGLRVGKDRIPVRVSIGATMIRQEDTAEELVRRADALMYQAKRAGGNQIKLE